MKRASNWLLAAAVAGGIGPAVWAADTPAPAAGAGNAAFSAELFAQLDKGADAKNLFLSPYSISMALAMTAQGARGQTRTQMDRVLHLGGDKALENQTALLNDFAAGAGAEEKPFTLSIANAIWSDQTFPMKADFIAAAQNQFHAEADTVDFLHAAEAGRTRINAWVQKQTNDKIKDLLPPGSVDRSTALVLTNAIYFKGAWQTPFTESATSDQPFHLNTAHEAIAPLMRAPSETSFGYVETDDFQAVELPYQMRPPGDRARGNASGIAPNAISMVVMLPKKVDGLAAMEKAATAENLQKWFAGFAPQRANVYLPRFKMTSSFDLNKTLQTMGMTDAFDRDADFSGITVSPAQKLWISAVIHKAFVSVDEKGTEAAAATGVAMVGMAMRPQSAPPIEFRADHPFLFAIRDRITGTILFMGHVVDPTK